VAPKNASPASPANPWLALDATAEWRSRAYSVARAREQVLTGHAPDSAVREVIVRSWKRSRSAGIDPDAGMPPSIMSTDEAAGRWENHPLGRAEQLLRDLFGEILYETRALLFVCDGDGSLIWRHGHPQTLYDATGLNADLGSSWSEASVGTNAMGTALAERHPLQVCSTEHFTQFVHPWACSAAPVHDPATGEVIGVINLSGGADTAHPHSLGLVAAAARLIEAQIAATSPQPTSAIAHLHLLRGEYPAFVGLAGPITLSLRHAELLTLLAIRREGWSAQALAIALYGDFGNPVSVRSEVSRLRQYLGPVVETRPYRLASTLRCDVIEMERLLSEGRLHAALDLHQGQLVTRSELPLIVEWRHWLDGQLRAAVLRSADPTVVERYLRCADGHDDEQALDRLLALLSPDDPRGDALRRRRRGPADELI
jgi:hypothetical protein